MDETGSPDNIVVDTADSQNYDPFDEVVEEGDFAEEVEAKEEGSEQIDEELESESKEEEAEAEEEKPLLFLL